MENKISAPTGVRLLGIDALRILCMLMVVMIHILGGGGILNNTAPFSAGYITAWTLKIGIYCAVNCYGLISGYVGINSKYKYTNILLLWLQALMYSVLGAVICYLIDPARVGGLRVLLSLSPLTQDAFWYFSAYTGLFLCIPILNRGILSLNRRQAKALCIAIILVVSVLPVFSLQDIFKTQNGSSMIWLIVLYVMGACIRRFDFFAKVPNRVLIGGYFLSVAVSVGAKLLIKADTLPILANFMKEDCLAIYPSPTLVYCGIALLLLFSRVKVQTAWLAKLVQIISPVAFGVYLIHMQPEVFDFLITDRFVFLASHHPFVMAGGVVLAAVIIFLVCGVIDYFRLFLFRTLKLKERLLKLEHRLLGELW